MLKPTYCVEEKETVREIGVDEAGRGPMLGRVYAAAVILPPDYESFNHALMKDSKKFHSEKKIREAAAYIKEKAIAWAIAYSSLPSMGQAVLSGSGGRPRLASAEGAAHPPPLLLVDGNDFTPFVYNQTRYQHVCIEGGDNSYASIAAASILAKVTRDDYIAELCKKEPSLIEHYDLLKNKGYGTKKHMDGIRAHGITPYHRKTYGLCRDFS